MKLDQFIGPFTSNLIFNRSNVTYLQIGVEHPHSTPISEIKEDDYGNIEWPIIVSINKGNQQSERDFIITERDLLELELNHESVNVIIHENFNPYIIINIAYEDTN